MFSRYSIHHFSLTIKNRNRSYLIVSCIINIQIFFLHKFEIILYVYFFHYSIYFRNSIMMMMMMMMVMTNKPPDAAVITITLLLAP